MLRYMEYWTWAISYFACTVSHFLEPRHTWRVDVINTRTNASTIDHSLSENWQEFLIWSRVLNCDDISIHIDDGVNDIIKVGVAHVGMDLHSIQQSNSQSAVGFMFSFSPNLKCLYDDLPTNVIMSISGEWTNLGGILHPTSSDAESMHSPILVASSFCLAQRQTFTKCCFINLDNSNSSCLQIFNLILNSQGNLHACFRSAQHRFHQQGWEKEAKLNPGYWQCNLCYCVPSRSCYNQIQLKVSPWLVVSHKWPVQDSHRTSEHALHWAFCQALSICWPEHSHGLGTAHISINDWGLHTARSIRLNPAISREAETFKLLTEVLNHVIPLQENHCTMGLQHRGYKNFTQPCASMYLKLISLEHSSAALEA